MSTEIPTPVNVRLTRFGLRPAVEQALYSLIAAADEESDGGNRDRARLLHACAATLGAELMRLRLELLDERERCAGIAEQTVCDTHLPTGVRIYGTVAAKAIRVA